jgi:hypothetical protein
VVYTNLHIDRQVMCWLYPLIEVNASYRTRNVDVDLPTRIGFLDLGNFTTTGTLVSLSVGANAVLIPSRLEFGAVYSFPVYTERDFGFNGLLAKMVVRY